MRQSLWYTWHLFNDQNSTVDHRFIEQKSAQVLCDKLHMMAISPSCLLQPHGEPCTRDGKSENEHYIHKSNSNIKMQVKQNKTACYSQKFVSLFRALCKNPFRDNFHASSASKSSSPSLSCQGLSDPHHDGQRIKLSKPTWLEITK